MTLQSDTPPSPASSAESRYATSGSCSSTPPNSTANCRSRRVALENAPDDIPELVAEILANAVERRLRRNLTAGYQRRQADLNRVRGRINLLRTERRQLLQRARVACVFDELTVDTPRNRYVRAALTHVAGVVKNPICNIAAATWRSVWKWPA